MRQTYETKERINLGEVVPVEDLKLTPKATLGLKKAGIESINILATKTRKDISAIPNLGRKTVEKILDYMDDRGFALKPTEKTSYPVIEEMTLEAAKSKLEEMKSERQKISDNISALQYYINKHFQHENLESLCKKFPHMNNIITSGGFTEIQIRLLAGHKSLKTTASELKMTATQAKSLLNSAMNKLNSNYPGFDGWRKEIHTLGLCRKVYGKCTCPK